MKNLIKIISGGQTGVDQAALKAAFEQGLQIGGWCPPGRICENGAIPEAYPLVESLHDRSLNAPLIKHSQRTEYNVRDSDATLVLSPAGQEHDKGTNWTLTCTRKYDKPYIVIDPYLPNAEQLVMNWFKRNSIKVLNIAGPSEKNAPGVSKQTYRLLRSVLIRFCE